MQSMKRCVGNRDSEQNLGLEFVRYPSFGRKRVLIMKNNDSFNLRDNSTKSLLENLPQETLIKILCGVNHDDLKQLCHVSTTIREAALIAKELHFAYSTPTKIKAFRTPLEFEEPSEFDEIEPPNAPKRPRYYKVIPDHEKLSSVTTVLFGSPKKELFMETEV